MKYTYAYYFFYAAACLLHFFASQLLLDMVFTVTSVKLLALYLLLDANEVFLHGRLPPTLPDIESEI